MQPVDVLRRRQRRQQGLRTGIVVRIIERLHRHLQQHLMAFAARARDPARKVVAIGGEGERHRSRQLAERLECAGRADAEPFDDDRDARPVLGGW